MTDALACTSIHNTVLAHAVVGLFIQFVNSSRNLCEKRIINKTNIIECQVKKQILYPC